MKNHTSPLRDTHSSRATARRGSRNRRFAILAALATGTCWQFGAGCVQTILATIGATFF